MREMPSISGSTYQTAAVNLAAVNAGGAWATPVDDGWLDAALDRGAVMRRPTVFNANHTQSQPQKETAPMSTRRLVQVFIADPNENIPLEQSLLYTGEQKLTDLTDQELFFEVDIKSILDKHNEKRTKIVDKKVKERTEYLEAAKIRDLKMVVVTVAGF